MFHPVKHLKTISKHKYEVWKLCVQAGIPIQGLSHDLSKFSPAEFIPGARFWVGDKSPQVLEREKFGYSAAWLHHKGKNRHHFEYWTDYVSGVGITTIEMPPRFLAEMFCDRVAASKVYQGDAYTDASPLAYFEWARCHYVMHPKTMEALEKLLIMLKEEGEKATLSYIRHQIVFASKKMRKSS